jgi:SLOG cluster2
MSRSMAFPVPMIAVSISDPGSEDLVRRGLSLDHLAIAYQEITGHVLAAVYGLTYGGFLEKGYSTRLLDQLRSYQHTGASVVTSRKRCHLMLADYIYDTTPQGAMGDAKNYATVTRHPDRRQPDGTPKPSSHSDADLTKALQLTEMRVAMTAEVSARVSLGGKPVGTMGRTSGVLEECYLTVQAGKPLYLIGGFGGATAVVVDAVRGIESSALSAVLSDSVFTQRSAEWQGQFDPRGGTEMLDALRSCGVAGLNNGLSEYDNETLMSTDDIDTIISLVMRGVHMTVARPT